MFSNCAMPPRLCSRKFGLHFSYSQAPVFAAQFRRSVRLNMGKRSRLMSQFSDSSSDSYFVSPSLSPILGATDMNAPAPCDSSGVSTPICELRTGCVRKISVCKSYGKPLERVPKARNFLGIVNNYKPPEVLY